jgi:hypothetical protein
MSTSDLVKTNLLSLHLESYLHRLDAKILHVQTCIRPKYLRLVLLLYIILRIALPMLTTKQNIY